MIYNKLSDINEAKCLHGSGRANKLQPQPLSYLYQLPQSTLTSLWCVALNSLHTGYKHVLGKHTRVCHKLRRIKHIIYQLII